MEINNYLVSSVKLDSSGVWVLSDHKKFNYSDGSKSEKYLSKVLSGTTDLSSNSSELENGIKDWVSEYHLSKKRSQLLSGFSFDRRAKVLEVGCGCGAITRFLAETFDTVIAVEGNINRARLAKARNRDIDSVSIVCAPFHKLQFKQSFDIIFCIGVFEYSGLFIEAINPYQAALEYFSSLLSDNGTLVLAIENQFGLKYFSNATEDHLGLSFAGIEGYHNQTRKVKTFGRTELHEMINASFKSVSFFYPYPDYKVPDCVVSENLLTSGSAGEIVAGLTSRDYLKVRRPYFDERSVSIELNRNKALAFFSNSFLVIAEKSDDKKPLFPQELIIYSSGRVPAYSTVTRAVKNIDNSIYFNKTKTISDTPDTSKKFQFVKTSDKLMNSFSILTDLLNKIKSVNASLDAVFSGVQLWFTGLSKLSIDRAGRQIVPCQFLDAVWSNSYLSNGSCHFIDLEWRYSGDLPLNVLVIRTVYDFLIRIDNFQTLPSSLRDHCGFMLIFKISHFIGCKLEKRDFFDFISIESEFKKAVYGDRAAHETRDILWFLLHRPSRRLIYKSTSFLKKLID